jgi:pimeloyl-ACP methyl ester carboxylesterase
MAMRTRDESTVNICPSPADKHARPVLTRRDMLRRSGATVGAALALGAGLDGLAAGVAVAAAQGTSGAKPNIVLVHGAWADGSSWDDVIALLLSAGYPVTAVAIPLTALADDVARTRSILAQQTGPTILVGHSIGGAVISGAGAGQPNVKALVYVSAFAPDQGESVGQLAGGSGFPAEPGTAIGPSLYPDSQGFIYLHRDAFLRYFAPDVAPSKAQVMAAKQRPVAGTYLSNTAGPAAWRTLPSWFLVSTRDQMINPDLQRFEATRMNATVLQVASSHASPVSHPLQVVQLITQAARVTVPG